MVLGDILKKEFKNIFEQWQYPEIIMFLTWYTPSFRYISVAAEISLYYRDILKVKWMILIIFQMRKYGKEVKLDSPMQAFTTHPLSLFLAYSFVYKNAIVY